MNNENQQSIEDKLKQLASLNPDEKAVERMNRRLRSQLGAGKPADPLAYSVLSAAAILLIIFSLWNWQPPAIKPLPSHQTAIEAGITRIELNMTFQDGGQEALEHYLNQVCVIRNAQTEPLTLQEIMKEL